MRQAFFCRFAFYLISNTYTRAFFFFIPRIRKVLMIVITKAEDKKKDTFGLFNSKNRRGIYGIGLGATLNVRDIECFPQLP